VTYTITATNDGNVPLTDVAISDLLLSTLTCVPTQPAVLAPGDTLVCTGSYTVTQADVDAGGVDNTADVSGSDGNGPPVTATADEDVPATQTQGVSIVKTSDATAATGFGELVTFRYLVTNTGNVTITSLGVVDSMGITVFCPVTTLAPDEPTTCTATYTVTQADVDAGEIVNDATATGATAAGPVDASTSLTTPLSQAPAITLDKTAEVATYDTVGGAIAYSYLITNSGDVTLTGPMSVSDDKVTVTCPAAAPVAPGATVTCTASASVAQSDLDTGSITNTATAHATFDGDPLDSASDAVTVTALQTPHLALAKTATEASFGQAGDVINYTITATNDGNVTLSGVTVSDPVLPGFSCAPDGPATLAPGASIVCTGTHTASQADVDRGSVPNTASASGTGPAAQPVEATATHDVPAVQSPALSITKTPDPDTYDLAGQTISYEYVVSNGGNVTLDGPITVSDDKVTVTCPAAASLAPGADVTCTATATVSQADIDAGSITNTATAHATFGGALVDSASVEATVTATVRASLTLDKSAGVATFDGAGQLIDYTYVLTNDGNVTIDGPLTITDDRTDVTCPAVSTVGNGDDRLDPGESLTCTASDLVSQGDVDAGAITNNARASGSRGGAPFESNADQVTVAAVVSGALGLVKTVAQASYTATGDTLDYTLVATNNGNATLTAVSISDSMLPDLDCAPVQPATLGVGESLTCTGSYAVTQNDVDAGSVTNSASAAATDPGGQPVTATDGVTVTGNGTAHVSLSKTVTETTYTAVGETLHYTIVVTNDGTATLIDVTISDPRLPSLDCTLAQPATLGVGESLTCTGTYTITQEDMDGGSVDNTATVDATGPADQPLTASGSATSTAAGVPHLSLAKTVNQAGFSAVGDQLVYTLVATNDGTVTLTDVTITDELVPGISCALPVPSTLAVGGTLACTATLVVTQADLDAGLVVNTATAAGRDASGTAVSAAAGATVASTLVPVQAIQIVKTASTYGLPSGGGHVDYTYQVLNSGNVPLAAVQVSDDRCAPVSYTQGDDGDGSLEPGELWTYVCDATLTDTTTNVATVRADYQGAIIEATAAVTVLVADPPAAQPTPDPTPRPTATPEPTRTPTPDPTATPRPTVTPPPVPNTVPSPAASDISATIPTLPPTDRVADLGRESPGGAPVLPVIVGLVALAILLLPRWRRLPLDD
jgi:uncharacterized repeat protein (TIGR01451 family)